jgi:hypothetical protein
MSYRVKLLIGVVLAGFAACHVAVAYKLDTGTVGPTKDAISLQRD